MTNTNIEYCEETHKDGWMCCYPRHHRGDHKAWGANKANPFATWPQEQPSMFAKGGFESPYLNCTSTHNIPNGPAQGMPIVCQLKAGHPGSHLKTFLTRDTVTWRDDVAHTRQAITPIFVMDEDLQDAKELKEIILDKIKTATTTQPTPVPLDVEELKILAYYLASVNEDDEDDVALKEKIDAALKKAL